VRRARAWRQWCEVLVHVLSVASVACLWTGQSGNFGGTALTLSVTLEVWRQLWALWLVATGRGRNGGVREEGIMNARPLTQDSPYAPTQARALRIDPIRSRIDFRIRWLGLIPVHGTLGGVNGEIVLDARRPERSSVRATVDVATIRTGIRSRDQHLRTADFFDVARYPQAEFASESVERVGPDRWRVRGTLDLHGARQPVALDTEYEDLGDGALRFKATTRLSRSDFAIDGDGPKTRLMVGNSIRVTVSLTAV
jgi:polyisoprenoid-binding protein YceI